MATRQEELERLRMEATAAARYRREISEHGRGMYGINARLALYWVDRMLATWRAIFTSPCPYPPEQVLAVLDAPDWQI